MAEPGCVPYSEYIDILRLPVYTFSKLAVSKPTEWTDSMSDRLEKVSKYVVIIAFAAMLVSGLLVYQDYGVTVDEPLERYTSLVAYKHIQQHVFGNPMPLMEPIESIWDYPVCYRYYGTFLQMPMVVIEHLEDFPVILHDVFLTRHLITFFYCYLGYLCFFFMCRQIFKNNYLALLGVLMLFLYPRYFATQFTLVKDMVYAATVMASMWATVMFLEKKESWFWGAVFVVVSVISANIRFISFIFPCLLIGYLFVRDLFVTGAFSKGILPALKRIGVYLLLGLSFLGCYILISPWLWADPLQGIVDTVKMFSQYKVWTMYNVFMGSYIQFDQVPWYYTPVWMLVSLPLWYIALFTAGAVLSIKALARRIKARTFDLRPLLESPKRYLVLSIILFVLPLILVAVQHSVLYNDWRHSYYLLVPFVLICLFTLKTLLQRIKRTVVKRTLIACVCAGLAFQIGWMIVNHPFEVVYFNRVAAPYGEQFDRDTTQSSTYSAYQYLLENAPEEQIQLPPQGVPYNRLTPEQLQRLDMSREDPQYLIENYLFKKGNDITYEGYSELHSFTVDGFKVVSIFEKDIDN